MSRYLTQLRSLPAACLALALLGLLASCPKQAADASGVQLDIAERSPDHARADGDTGSLGLPDPLGVPPTAGTPPTPEFQQQPADEPPRKVSTGSGLKPPPKKDPEEMSYSERAEAERIRRMRGENETRRRFGQQVSFEFLSARFNPDPGATMSDLYFAVGERTGERLEFVATSGEREPTASLELGDCTLKVTPQLAGPEERPLGSSRAVFQWIGRYAVDVLNHNGRRLCTLVVDPEGDLQQWETAQGYITRVHRDPDTHQLTRLGIHRNVEGSRGEEIMLLRWHKSGYNERSASDGYGNRFQYRFPAGRLELIEPD